MTARKPSLAVDDPVGRNAGFAATSQDTPDQPRPAGTAQSARNGPVGSGPSPGNRSDDLTDRLPQLAEIGLLHHFSVSFNRR